MASDWFGISLDVVVFVIASALAMYLAMLVLVRIAGLRSFAEMTSFDFAMTIAIGTILGTTAISASISVPVGAIALATLFVAQAGIARARVHSDWFSGIVDNEPRLVMAQGRILSGPLEQTRLTEEDIYAKLREANVRNFNEVLAVVVETTGDVSVVHTQDEDVEFDITLLTGVEGVETAFGTKPEDAKPGPK